MQNLTKNNLAMITFDSIIDILGIFVTFFEFGVQLKTSFKLFFWINFGNNGNVSLYSKITLQNTNACQN